MPIFNGPSELLLLEVVEATRPPREVLVHGALRVTKSVTDSPLASRQNAVISRAVRRTRGRATHETSTY